MQKHRQEQIAQYVAEYTGSYPETTLTTWITYGVDYLDTIGSTEPGKAEYQRLKAEICATLPGRKGKPISLGQANKYVSETQKFYEWLHQREGEKQQINLCGGTKAEAIERKSVGTEQQIDIELLGSEAVTVHEVPVHVESVAVQEAESAEQQEVTTGENTSSLFVNTSDDIINKKKRGRKHKAENADRVQVSVYLSSNVYEGLKALAQAKNINLSDIVARTANRFFERNIQAIATAQQALKNLEVLDVDY